MRLAVDLILDSSALLHIHHAASRGFKWYMFRESSFFSPTSFGALVCFTSVLNCTIPYLLYSKSWLRDFKDYSNFLYKISLPPQLKKVHQTTNMKISSMHTSRQQQNTFQQKLKLAATKKHAFTQVRYLCATGYNRLPFEASYCGELNNSGIICAKNGKVMPTMLHVGEMIKVRRLYEW